LKTAGTEFDADAQTSAAGWRSAMRFGRPLFNLQMLALGWRYSAGLVREFFSLRCVLVWPIHRWLSRLAPVVLRNVRILAPPHSSLTPVLTNGNALPAGELILLTHGR
jgi:hypothetical protein